jgi:hypothetical protein
MKRRVLASGRLGILLVLLGVGTFATTLFPFGTAAPRDATWIFVPQDRYPSDYALEGVTLWLDLANSSCSVLRVEIRLSIYNKTRDYSLGVLQPLQVIEERTTASNPRGRASKPSTTVTPSASYFTRSNYSFENLGYASILLDVPVLDPITFRELGRRGTGFTFGSGYGFRNVGHQVEEFMRDANPSVILNRGLTLSIIYPATWTLSLAETFPQPNKEFAADKDRVATWLLNLHEILPEYLETATIFWTIPQELQVRDLVILVSGSVFSLGATILVSPYRERTETAQGYLLYRRIRRRILQALGQWRK